MHITIEHFSGQYPSFNVNLHSKPGNEAFVSIKGCKIVNGQNGAFVSYPSRKNEQTGKYWSHVWGSEQFNAVVLQKAKESQPIAQAPAPKASQATPSGWDDLDESSTIPF